MIGQTPRILILYPTALWWQNKYAEALFIYWHLPYYDKQLKLITCSLSSGTDGAKTPEGIYYMHTSLLFLRRNCLTHRSIWKPQKPSHSYKIYLIIHNSCPRKIIKLHHCLLCLGINVSIITFHAMLFFYRLLKMFSHQIPIADDRYIKYCYQCI